MEKLYVIELVKVSLFVSFEFSWSSRHYVQYNLLLLILCFFNSLIIKKKSQAKTCELY